MKPKARLVVRGFQEAGLRDLDTFSPTCSRSSWRVLLTVASYRGWAPIAVDISTAFLQGGALQCEVCVRHPQELHAPGQLLKLRIGGVRACGRSTALVPGAAQGYAVYWCDCGAV